MGCPDFRECGVKRHLAKLPALPDHLDLLTLEIDVVDPVPSPVDVGMRFGLELA
jgi:hypothetical protein